jgi:hypothetical protein
MERKSVKPQLSGALGRRDEEANILVAKKIATKKDYAAVEELIGNIKTGNHRLQNDSIKALYETGNLDPSLIKDFVNDFYSFLGSKNNRLQWGAMTALAFIAKEEPEKIFRLLPGILKAAESGSVITKDQCVKILAELYSLKKYSQKVFPLIKEQLLKAPENQFAMYAEMIFPIISEKDVNVFKTLLLARLKETEKESKRKRIEKMVKRL